VIPQRNSLKKQSNEAYIQLAFQAIKQDAKLSIPRAAALYNVPERTLRRRRDVMLSRRDITPNSMKLLKTEEETIVRHILDLEARY